MRALEKAFPVLGSLTIIADGDAIHRSGQPKSVDRRDETGVAEPCRWSFAIASQIGETHRIPDLEMALVVEVRRHDCRRIGEQSQEDWSMRAILSTWSKRTVRIDRSGETPALGRTRFIGGGGNEIMRLIADIDAGRTHSTVT